MSQYPPHCPSTEGDIETTAWGGDGRMPEAHHQEKRHPLDQEADLHDESAEPQAVARSVQK